ncbi:ubiquitin-conjugating enzyme/RWD-like protein [Pseudomassariella vexata]|uniref:Ubiquitin-conjugating enzyme/RWD-like protein n=1 Tax=Pseudomassariella vexata TaxID=1141098 RepID=A0A1Y2DLK1_9PEZI|nr:ubiquitin-conjugating enzyme/RWD-like protein [Pseudomassariella vexata]ORY60140.1 ubiquitin-conjugating enzyme/RWD-like protein [Pseudomassariella vexata]
MGREEQVEEREVLDSIFPEEITDISDTEYRISILLDVPPDDDEDTDEPPTIVLHVRYPENYPDEPPVLELSAPQNVPTHPQFSVASDKDQLLQGLEETIQENLGMAMVFTLVTTLKENAEQLVADRKAELAKAHEEALLAAEREENKKFHGTPVTPETFVKWRAGFIKEMEEERLRLEEERLAELKKSRVKEEKKLTGKQLWERGLVGKIDEGEDEDTGLAEGVESLKVAS